MRTGECVFLSSYFPAEKSAAGISEIHLRPSVNMVGGALRRRWCSGCWSSNTFGTGTLWIWNEKYAAICSIANLPGSEPRRCPMLRPPASCTISAHGPKQLGSCTSAARVEPTRSHAEDQQCSEFSKATQTEHGSEPRRCKLTVVVISTDPRRKSYQLYESSSAKLLNS